MSAYFTINYYELQAGVVTYDIITNIYDYVLHVFITYEIMQSLNVIIVNVDRKCVSLPILCMPLS